MGITLKDIYTEHDIAENQFAIKLANELEDKNYYITVINDKYSNVDFKLTNGDKTIYLELKSRKSLSLYDTFFISHTKIVNISKLFRNTILVWSFQNMLYFFYYDDGIFDFKTRDELDKRNNKYYKTILVPKKKCITGFKNLIELIKTNLNE